jgi:hypothetical protein
MSKDQKDDLLLFMQPFSDEIHELVLWLRELIWDHYPQTNELIYDNYNALAIGWSTTDKVGHTFCSIAIGRTSKNIHFGFYWGSKISDPEHRLLGKGNQYRYILVTSKQDFPKVYMESLMNEAYQYSLSSIKEPSQIINGQTITKSVSPIKRQKKLTLKTGS